MYISHRRRLVTDEVRQNIADADVVVLEANHDEDMLKMAVIRRYSSRGFWEHAGIIQCFGSLAAGAYGAPAGRGFSGSSEPGKQFAFPGPANGAGYSGR